MDLDTWRAEFLTGRRSRREGDPLHTYRLQAGEFDSLERGLRAALAAHPPHLAIDRMSGQAAFQACFVLYAAEWWKRRYEGGSWTWKPILESLGVPWEAWSANTRSQCVQDGLRRWGINLLDRAGLRYLGSVAAQGGLPLRLIQDARGQIGYILQSLVRLGAKAPPTADDLIGWIESLAGTLPRHYRQREIYELLAGLAQTILYLAQDMGDEQQADPLAWLDAHHRGDWRRRFPVEVEDDVVKTLLEGLFREAISERHEQRAHTVSAIRYLASTVQEGLYQLGVEVAFPVRMEAKDLAALFGVSPERIPRAATITYTSGGNAHRVDVSKLPGHAVYQVRAKALGARGDAAMGMQQISLGSEQASIARCVLPQGERLEDDLPWVFDARLDQSQRWPLLRQGGGRFAPAEVIACIPIGALVRHAPGSRWTRIGTTEGGGRALYRISGQVTIVIGSDLFRISTQQADATDEALEWSGNHLWGVFDVPLFRGAPSLFRRNLADGHRQIVPGTPVWKVLGTQAPVNTPVGPVEARWPPRGEIEWRSRLVALPAGAALRLQSGNHANEGTVTLAGWRVRRVVSCEEGVKIISFEQGADLQLEIEWTKEGEPAPEEIEVEFLWPHTTHISKGRLPFPGRGIVLRGQAGSVLANGAKVCLQTMHGTRFLVYDSRATIILSAGGQDAGRSGARRFEIESPPDARRIEICPIDFREAIEELLAGTNRDGYVEFYVTTVSGDRGNLRINRFAGELKPDGAEIVGFEPGASVLALRLNEAGAEPVLLDRLEAGAARWKFETDGLATGPWLIYEAPECAGHQRPLLKTIFGESAPGPSPLANAIGAPDRQRPEALRVAIGSMVADASHPDWRLAEDLARVLGHIPLPYLDLWSRFSDQPRSLAALAFRSAFPDEFLRRWVLDLPFLWELVPLSAWREAANGARERLRAKDVDEETIRLLITSRMRLLSEHCESLQPLLDVALQPPQQGRDVRPGYAAAIDQHLRASLYEADNSPLQQFIRAHLEEEWPRGLVPELREAVETWSDLKKLLPPAWNDHRDNAVRLPIVLAYAAVRDHRPLWLSGRNTIVDIRSYRRVDPAWFQSAFATTCQRLLLWAS